MRVTVRRQMLPLLLVAALSGAAACDSNATTGTTTTTTTTPTTFQTTETFQGMLTMNGGQSYSFNVTTSGTVFVTLTALSDPLGAAVPVVGLHMGTWNGTSCSIQTGIFTDNAGLNASIAGTVTGAGQLCARVYDSGSRVVNPLSFTITVVHP